MLQSLEACASSLEGTQQIYLANVSIEVSEVRTQPVAI